jgi:hypothetical protein
MLNRSAEKPLCQPGWPSCPVRDGHPRPGGGMCRRQVSRNEPRQFRLIVRRQQGARPAAEITARLSHLAADLQTAISSKTGCRSASAANSAADASGPAAKYGRVTFASDT